MKSLLKEMIIEFHAQNLPKLVHRDIALPPALKTKDSGIEVRKANIFIGMRRSGKTHLMYQHMEQLLSSGLSKTRLVYINFEDDRLITFSLENFQDLLDVYFELYPQYKQSEEVYFYFDEIQNIEHWEKFIRRLLDKEKMQIYITGSSAKMLSAEIATSLRGRSWKTEVFPLSFEEYLTYKAYGYDVDALSQEERIQMQAHVENYLQYGGFPESLDLTLVEHRKLLQDYVDVVILRDVVERHEISNVHIVRLFITHCLSELAKPQSIKKIYNDFKSQGWALTKDSLYKYLEYVSDAYLWFSVPIYSLSIRKRQVNLKKIYGIDTGIINAYATQSAYAKSFALENAVFLALRRKLSGAEEQRIFYYKTKNDREVDFLFINDDQTISLYQVALRIEEASTREREIRALCDAAQELLIKDFYIITLNHEEEIKMPECHIQVLPYWKFCLNTPIQEIFKKNQFSFEKGMNKSIAYSLTPFNNGHAIYMLKTFNSSEKLVFLDKTQMLLEDEPVKYMEELRCNLHHQVVYHTPAGFEEKIFISRSHSANEGFYFSYGSAKDNPALLDVLRTLVRDVRDYEEKIIALTENYLRSKQHENEGFYMRVMPLVVTDSPLELQQINNVSVEVPWVVCELPDFLQNKQDNPMDIKFVYIVKMDALDAFINGRANLPSK